MNWLRPLVFGLGLWASLGVFISAWANPCALPGSAGWADGSGMGGTGINGSGTGGTGHRQDGSGMGGTGHATDGSGMGGTGRQANSGLGGTGKQASSGLGGTGKQANSGLGGTGKQADGGVGGTGVVGLITGFASICVNGVEINFDGNTPVSVDGEQGASGQLAIGQLVSVEAEGQGDTMRARHISVNSAVVGQISWVAPDGQSFMALGQFVRVAPEGAPMNMASQFSPRPGDMVRVSGLRDASGAVRATHIERVRPDTPASVTGRLDSTAQVNGRGVGRIGGLPVLGIGAVAAGEQVRVVGVERAGVLQAQRVEVNPTVKFAEKLDRLLLQGMVAADGQGGVTLGYTRIQSVTPAAAEKLSQARGQWVRVEAKSLSGGGIGVNRVEIDRPALRRDSGSEGKSREERRSKNRETSRETSIKERHSDEIERPEETPERERPEKIEIERPEVERPEKVEIERPEIERPEIERPEIERPEIERPEIERPEKIEKPEKIEIEKIEKPEKIERHD
ncbi:MAG: hypothetical protein B7Y41_09820 [Hydrogenophilales bacterium 28-61-23]|nr:MAG: hypothetical protein B7Y41_09820 [Hydrogenophilales bacterium 28-61-23]